MKHRRRHVEIFVAFSMAAVVGGWTIALVKAGPDITAGRIQIKTLSTDASRVTGGDVLLEIAAPATMSSSRSR